MSVFTKLSTLNKEKNKQLQPIQQLEQKLSTLLLQDEYIARSSYLGLIKDYKEQILYLETLQSDLLLKEYCKKQKLDYQKVLEIIENYNKIASIINKHNKTYIQNKLISEKEYLDKILYDCDKNILLDDDQRKVILTDEDYSLVIAGAGAGKTTTVAAKVKYLVDKKNVKPEEILVVSFTNKAVEELKERIQKQLKINCPITTFHSTGNAILHKETDEKLNIVQPSTLYFVLEAYFRDSIMKSPKNIEDLITFFSDYFDNPIEFQNKTELYSKLTKSNYSTLKSELNEINFEIMENRTKKKVTIQNEIMRSQEEVRIANFLYLNGIEYIYEPNYKYSFPNSNKIYTPDFLIYQNDNEAYLEHFGITQSGKSNRYSIEELERYKKAVKEKVQFHRKHGTNLIYTFSSYDDGKSLIEHLKQKLQENNFKFYPRDKNDVLRKITTQDTNRYIRKIITLMDRFISNFKINGYEVEKFDEWQNQTENVRTKLFLKICKECYLEYERYLQKNNKIDFSDMINKSAKLLRESKEVANQIDFKYIIVDEYQDISKQRFDLVGALHDVCSAKIIAVGDDWQSIYAFSGSDIKLFTKFSELMGYAELLKITKTYRNSQEVIDIAGNFIQKNKNQIQKRLISPKSITDPVIIYTYNSKYKKTIQRDNQKVIQESGTSFHIAKAVEKAIEQIIEYEKLENKDSKKNTILLLGRFGFDAKKLEQSELFEYSNYGSKITCRKFPYKKITFMTVHSSKGLGYDDVIVINCKNETYGFPAKIEDDPVLRYVEQIDDSIEEAEERRLFYVAMTRTKNRVYLIAPEANPSEFLLELKQDYKNIILKGEWNEKEQKLNSLIKNCPICGYPMQRKMKNACGLNLWICMNDPEICDFMTNEIEGEKLAIQKCDLCDGYLIVRHNKQDGKIFLGCTNYSQDKTGCSRIIGKIEYYKSKGYIYQ